jgi:CheY-like chemotaxis protein
MPRYRILVVDDSELVQELARLALETHAGWEVSCVSSGAEALALAPSEQPDAVLLDVEMPELDGPGTVAALRADAVSAGVPIVFLTGHDDPDELARLDGLDVAGILAKPFDVSTLADQLAHTLGWPR